MKQGKPNMQMPSPELPDETSGLANLDAWARAQKREAFGPMAIIAWLLAGMMLGGLLISIFNNQVTK